jgi:hypothetical protein
LGAIVLKHTKNIEKEIYCLRERLNTLIEDAHNGESGASKEILEISKKLDSLILEYYKDKNDKDITNL